MMDVTRADSSDVDMLLDPMAASVASSGSDGGLRGPSSRGGDECFSGGVLERLRRRNPADVDDEESFGGVEGGFKLS